MEKFLSVEEVAAALDMNPESVRRCLRKGNLQGHKDGRDWKIPESELAKKFETLQHYRVFCKSSTGAAWESSFLAPKWEDWAKSSFPANQDETTANAITADATSGSPNPESSADRSMTLAVTAADEIRDAKASFHAMQDVAVSVAVAISSTKQARSAVISAIEAGELGEREYELQIYPQLVFLRELTTQIEAAWEKQAADNETNNNKTANNGVKE